MKSLGFFFSRCVKLQSGMPHSHSVKNKAFVLSAIMKITNTPSGSNGQNKTYEEKEKEIRKGFGEQSWLKTRAEILKVEESSESPRWLTVKFYI